MTKLVLDDAFLSINSVDLSAHVQSVTLNYEAEGQDCTTMGDDTREMLGGLKVWSIDVTFVQDFASNLVDATLFGIVGSQVACILRPVKGTVVGATNPNYTGTGLILNPYITGELLTDGSCLLIAQDTFMYSSSGWLYSCPHRSSDVLVSNGLSFSKVRAVSNISSAFFDSFQYWNELLIAGNLASFARSK